MTATGESKEYGQWAALAACAVGFACLLGWSAWLLAFGTGVDAPARLPGEDRPAASANAAPNAGKKQTFFQAGATLEKVLPGEWPCFRGDKHDNIASESVPLVAILPKGGLKKIWSLTLGEGHAGAAVKNGRAYVLDYDEARKADTLRCLSLDTGAELWRRGYAVRIKRNHGMSRTVPAVTDKHAVSIGPLGQAMCVDAATGELRWLIDLVAEHGAKIPPWYAAQCPLVDGGVAVLAPCGKDLLLGVDCESGEIVFRTPAPAGWSMSHSSITPMALLGKKCYVYCATGGVAAVSAEADDRGRLLWQTGLWNNRTTAPSPAQMGEDKIFFTAGYGVGSLAVRIVKKGESYTVEKLYALDKTVFACEQHTPVFRDGLLFAILPKDGGVHRQELACLTPEGEALWYSGRENRFGLGPYLAVGGDKFLILSDEGELTLAKVSRAGFEKLWSEKVLAGPDAWAPLALAGGRLLLRDSRTLVCLDLAAR